MMEHLYITIIVTSYNFISQKTSFLCYYKPHLPMIYSAYPTRKFFRDSPFDFEFVRIKRFRLFRFIGY